MFKSAFLTFSIGALLTALLIFFFEPRHDITLLCPKMATFGGIDGRAIHHHYGAGGAKNRHGNGNHCGDFWATFDGNAD